SSSDAAALPPNYQGLWWRAPAGSEAGWGLNVAHQGDTVFATWFTYDLQGEPLWLAAELHPNAAGAFSGVLFTTTGPAFGTSFDPARVTETDVGTATLSFTDAENGTFSYTINAGALGVTAISQTKAITRQVFGPVPTCVWGGQSNLALATNYQDLW